MARYASCARCSLGSAEADFGERGLEGAEEGLVGLGLECLDLEEQLWLLTL